MLDIHTHILPALDDGSKSVQQSVAMLRREEKQGIGRVVFTPHFYADREAPEHFMKLREMAYQKVKYAIAENGIMLQPYLGAEVAYFSGMSRTDEIDRFCIGDTRALLIEMPFCRWNQMMLEEIFFLKEYRGIQPIIAHVERYIHFQPWGMLRQLSESDIWIQANAEFFIERRTSWLAMHMLKRGWIHFIGSDCHNTDSRSPNMGQALLQIDKKLGRTARDYLEYMEQRLLEGD